MKALDLKPSKENVIKSFLEDSISRNVDLCLFVNMLFSIEGPFSIALDGAWGSGKTFFAKQIKLILDSINEHAQSVDNETRRLITEKYNSYDTKNEMEIKPQLCVYYDAWENDNDEDPVISLVYNIITSIGEDYLFNDTPDYIELGAIALESLSGRPFAKIIERLRSNKVLEDIKKHKQNQENVREFLDSIITERGDRLVIIVDELDRCNPEFAVRLLERIKHYFDNDRITFIFSVNMYELQHTIHRYYGQEFSVDRYLDRFFDLKMSLPTPDYQEFYRSFCFNTYFTYDIICDAVIRYYGFQMREVLKYYSATRIAASKVVCRNSYSVSYALKPGLEECIIIIVPIMVGLKLFDNNKYIEFVNGRDCTPLIEISKVLRDDYFEFLLDYSETYGEPEEGVRRVSVSEKLKDLYKYIFGKDFTGSMINKTIGKFRIDIDIRKILCDIVGLFSIYSVLNETPYK